MTLAGREDAVSSDSTKHPAPESNVNNSFLSGFFWNRTSSSSHRRSSDEMGRQRRKSFAQYAFDVFPRFENYLNSKIKPIRPSIGELHSGENENKESTTVHMESEKLTTGHIKLGWIQGVLIPVLLNIWGVMLFLRLSWVVGQAGIGESLLIVFISSVVCTITTLSLSAISTNGEVKGGGIYFIISRSLGPEFGASIGIVFAVANAISASMNTIGFCDSLNELLDSYGLKIIDGGINDTRIIGLTALLIMIIICAVGMDWETKAQNFLVAIIVGAIFVFITGAFVGPSSDSAIAKGFTGIDSNTFKQNWFSDYRIHENVAHNFFTVFSIFFPSVTGIQAGANISGDLKDPSYAIPKGTLIALFISMASYIIFILISGASEVRDASGLLTDVINGTITACSENCEYGLQNSYEVMQLISQFGTIIYAGCFAATISTALTNLLSVPKLIQALGTDRIYPGLLFFAKGYGKHNEPYRGYVVTFIVAAIFVLIADLNAIAPLISNFYLASYALINFCTFHAALIKPLGWRPTFKMYNMWLSLVGFLMCVLIMFLIDWVMSLVTFILIFALYLVVVYRNPNVNWGSSTQAQTYKNALSMVYRVSNTSEHVKNYHPQILVLSGKADQRPNLVDMANLITKNNSLLIMTDIYDKKLSYHDRINQIHFMNCWLQLRKVRGFYSLIDGLDFEDAVRSVMQVSGVGKLKPNILMMGYKNNWSSCGLQELNAYFHVLLSSFDNRLSIVILRIRNGLCSETNSKNKSKVDLETVPGDQQYVYSNPAYSSQDSLGIALDLFANKEICIFNKKQPPGTIDVWWLYDDGGLAILIPHIISTRQNWAHLRLRVFALSTKTTDLESDKKNLSLLLDKFRISYQSIQLFDISDEPQQETIDKFDEIVNNLAHKQNMESTIKESELIYLRDQTHRQLRLRELLEQNSTNATLVALSLPIPHKNVVSAPMYMAWLEIITKDMPPFLMIRGNQSPVLTFYAE